MPLNFLKSRSRAIAIAAVLVVAVGSLDYSTGRDWQVVSLYLLPLALAVWAAGPRWGIFFSVLAAGTWLAAELAGGAVYSHPGAPYWNALMFLMVFLAVALSLARLHAIMQTLERRVKARTTQLRDEMTRRHKADLARLRAGRLAAVGTMAAQVAHEVRNPMCSISLNLDLLSHEIGGLATDGPHSPDEATLLLAQIRQEIGRVETVMRDYLGFARLPKVVPQQQSLHAFLDERLALTKAELATARVRLVKDYDPRIESVDLDPVQMWQVILNLIQNACEAMPEGGEIRMGTHWEGDEILISVSDTGIGISEEDHARLFTPFFSTKAQGTGLGLALSQQIVAEHRGRLECRSTPGSGTTFTISLPCPKQVVPSDRPRIDLIKTKPSAFHERHLAGSR